MSERKIIERDNLEAILQDELRIRSLRLLLPEERREHLDSEAVRWIEDHLLTMNRERREQVVDTFRDLVPVIRDLLTTWEALKQSNARGKFLSEDDEVND